MNVSKVGRRGQIAIPRLIRQELNLQEGDRLAFVRRGDEVVLQPLKTTLSDFRGSIPVSEPQDFDAIRQQVLDRRAYRSVTDDD
ncbi:AbrB/MazE/SpoVT family DNA-binding domain-containing protein [Synechococcales cyanobacterium C]|uniref:AbrB/MazE/SpoVT family DNA-binding domain-containing protein n=1 Tax=Petrachloros mirabilis ULC683 TaxID=2781853 RepID=A0A8K1ZYQ2_9CYAN|nr:AbrB/MazE/SpoVT family DNA-binding domain-containing protein [Petrachloros mirabilis]NCJ06398.1 AbrB/MazE/SpoVT family DNA-binding domain-containing protein [Petrachloros mirabilis ULC683]